MDLWHMVYIIKQFREVRFINVKHSHQEIFEWLVDSLALFMEIKIECKTRYITYFKDSSFREEEFEIWAKENRAYIDQISKYYIADNRYQHQMEKLKSIMERVK